ncbi:MAG: Hsp20/alpha crystallin family protein [Betaproteobacteria bacterium]
MNAIIRTNGAALGPRALFNDPWLNQVFGEPATRATTAEIRLDVEETADAYVLRADLPGVPKDQIKVDIDADVVTIAVEYKREAGTDARALRVERVAGHASRAIRLPVAIDATKAEARHVDGVLQLTLPKLAPTAKRLTIN